jgi:excisionase family DNA binding protein
MSKTNPNITRFYTKQEVAKMLRVSMRTVTRYMHFGLPYRKIGGTVRIPENELFKWIREK